MSFYDIPRKAPIPTRLNNVPPRASVPEISLFLENASMPPPRFNHRPPPAASHTHPPPPPTTTSSITDSFVNPAKKHVHFESGRNKENRAPPPPFRPHTVNSTECRGTRTFEQIYLANVPNRKLDLSVLDAPQTPLLNAANATNIDAELDEFRQRVLQSAAEKNQQITSKHVANVQSENEPTIRDLIDIVKAQSEQIALLQRQVTTLKDCVENTATHKNGVVTNNNNNELVQWRQQQPTTAAAFDVKATSFEVSFRPHNQQFRRNLKYPEPQIINTVDERDEEGDDDEIDANLSLNLHQAGSIHMCESGGVEGYSPPPSIRIDMDEYRSNYDHRNDDNRDAENCVFYRGLMDQVNNMLKKVQKRDNVDGAKSATLQFLKEQGVNLEHSNTPKSGDETFAVKQLLMKYLPGEQLAQIGAQQNGGMAARKCRKVVNEFDDDDDRAKKTPDFSVATLRYMEKYDLLRPSVETNAQNGGQKSKILDISKLKMQPKLL